MKPVYFLLPHHDPKGMAAVSRWISNLPELSLLAPITTEVIAWQQGVTGGRHDWIKTVASIEQHWQEAQGFVIWAPQASLLELAGTCALLFPKPGKPMIFFSAEVPDLKKADPSDLVGLKSTLINASYIACADLGEVGVLVGHTLYRPSSCRWTPDGRGVSSSQLPLATVDFQLHLQGDYRRRSAESPKISQPPQHETSLAFIAWHPGATMPAWRVKPQALMVAADARYWEHEEIQDLRQRVRGEEIPAIWLSHQTWTDQAWEKNEIGISHEQDWWAALVSNYAFAVKKSPQPSLRLIDTLIRH